VAKKRTVGEASRHKALLALVRKAKPQVIKVTAQDTGLDPADIDTAFDQVLDLVASPTVTDDQVEAFRREGIRLARAGAEGSVVLDGYLSLNWAIWEAAMQHPEVDRDVALGLADRLMKGIDSAVAALSKGYLEVEVELAASHSERRRSVIEELLSGSRSTPQDRTRIRRRAERFGLGAEDEYRLILIASLESDDEAQDTAIDRLEPHVRVPVSHHRTEPGIRLPVVLEWRGQILILTSASWTGEPRLRKALPKVLNDKWIAVDSGSIQGIEPLADERMGDEFIETLEVYMGARQNIRESARRLHLAPRTVAYRLERIVELLGHELEGDASMRINAALLALKVTRQAERS
jgi:hypothetical protein